MPDISNFDVLKEMGKRNLDIRLSPLDNITRLQRTKAGTQVTIGVAGDVVAALGVNHKFVGGLLLADREQFESVRAEMAGAKSGAERLPFWSDDFDMDLLKVFPDVPKMLREPDRVLWTVGHESFGRLNHPVTCNSRAFLWLARPTLERNEHGWIDVRGCVCNEPLVECTWMEWLRDAWSHHYSTVILPSHKVMPAADWPAFERIMSNMRAWSKQDVSEARTTALRWIMRCDFILHSVIAEMAGNKPDPLPKPTERDADYMAGRSLRKEEARELGKD